MPVINWFKWLLIRRIIGKQCLLFLCRDFWIFDWKQMESYTDAFIWHLLWCICVCEGERERETHRTWVSSQTDVIKTCMICQRNHWTEIFSSTSLSLFLTLVSWNWCFVYLTAVEFFTARHFLLALFIVLRFTSNAEICSFHLLEKTLICNAPLIIRLFSHIYLPTYLTTKPCVGKKSQWMHLRSRNMKNT